MSEGPETNKLAGEQRRNGILQRMDEYQALAVASFETPSAVTILGVVTFGLYQLKSAEMCAGNNPQSPALYQGLDQCADAALGLKAESDANLFARWHDAMCAVMGAEEVQKFVLAWCQAHHR